MTPFLKKAFVFLAALAAVSPALLSQTAEAAKVLEQTSGGVVGIITYGADKSETGTGSAFALAEDVVATAYHLISQAYDAEAVTAKGKKIKVDGVIGMDKVHDIALLKLKGKLTPLALSAGGSDSLAAGARIFAVGNNESRQIVVSEGTFRRNFDAGSRMKAMEMSIAITDRDKFTGGPILDLNGQVLGMVIVFDRGLRIGVPAGLIQAVTRAAKPTDFKSWTREDYFETFEGAALAGLAAAGLDENASARRHLEKASKLNPGSAEVVWALANVYDKQRDLSSAAETYKKVTDADPSKAEAFYKLGSVLTKMQKYPDAIAAYEKAISLNVGNKEVYFELGTTYEYAQDWAKAAAAYEKYIGLKPEVTWNAYLRLGFCRSQLKEFDAAIAAYQEALKAQPSDLKIHNSLADVYEKAGQYAKAEETYNTLAQLNPKDAKSYYNQAIRMYDAAGLYDKAVGPAKKIVELEPKNEMNVYNVAIMYLKLKNYDEAIVTFKQVVAIKPDMANAWFQIGSAYFQQKRYKEAADAYRRYAQLAPEESNGWMSLGVSLMYLKDYEGALEPMKKCVDLKPDNANALFNLAVVYINLKDMQSARDILPKLQALDPALAEKLRKYLR